MMKALLINPKPGFCYFSFPEGLWMARKRALGIPLGLITAAALLPAEWQLRLVDLQCDRLTAEHWDWADIVLLSGNLLHRKSALELISEAKQRRKTVVIGGPYASTYPTEVVDAGADFVVIGEGENTVPRLLEAIRAGEKRGVIENPEKPDMSSSPIPRFDLLNRGHYLYAQIQTSRGCPFDCEFCDIVTRFGRIPRYKAPSQVTAELETLYKLGWRGLIFIADDNFVGNKQRARAIVTDVLAWQNKRGEPFSLCSQASVNLGRDLELIDLMTSANLGQMFMGVESPDEEALKLAHKTQNLVDSPVELLNSLTKNGMSCMPSFIIGFDGEQKGVGERICKLVQETAVPVVMLGTLWAIPMTKLWDRLQREGRLQGEALPDWQDFVGGRFNFVTSRPESEIADEFCQTWEYLYESSRFLERTYRYYLLMRPTRAAKARATGVADDTIVPSEGWTVWQLIDNGRTLARMLWLLGIRGDARIQFWQQLFGMLRNNPSRMKQYLGSCGHGPDLFRIRKMVMDQRAASKEREKTAGSVDTEDATRAQATSGARG